MPFVDSLIVYFFRPPCCGD